MSMQGSRYDLLREIGRNHYSIVHDGYDAKMQREVAVMELLPEFRTDDLRWSQIWRQTQALVNAKIENVVPIYDALEEQAWIIMEIMLGHLAAEGSPPAMSGNQVRSVLRQVLLALRSYHELGVIHGDVKPANLWYDREGFVKLSFSPGLILGGQVPRRHKDFTYLAPEMVASQWGELSPQTDLYCLGLTALELLCGPAFDRHFNLMSAGDVDLSAAWTHWHASADELPSVSQLVPSTPPDLVHVIDRLIRKPAAERYPSSSAAAAELSDRPNVQITAAKRLARHSSGTLAPNRMIGGLVGASTSTPAETTQPTDPQRVHPSSTSGRRHKRLLHPAVAPAFIGVIAIPVLVWFLLSSYEDDAVETILVRLLSAPPGAAVRIDDREVEGRTPMAVGLESGEHHVEMTLDGYFPVEETLRVSAGDAQPERRLTLAKLTQPTPTPTELTHTEPIRTEPTPPEQPSPQPAQPERTTLKLKPIVADVTPPPDSPPPPKPTPLPETTPTPETKSLTETKPRPEMTAQSGLPDGLEASGAELHPTWNLPLRVIAPRTGTPPLTFALIEPREFYFGTQRPLRGELSRTTETIVEPFYLSVTEVSNQQYRKFIEETNAMAEQKLVGAADALPDGGLAYPVRNVGHAQAAGFCRWVSATGRLPREVEWELAACGGSDQQYPWGNGPRPSGQNCNLAHDGRQELMPVDAYPEGATRVGLLNMLGNVAEWCEETYRAGYRDTGAPGVGTNRVIRGGSFLEDPRNTPIRVTTRSHAAEKGAAHVGFRVLIPATPRQP